MKIGLIAMSAKPYHKGHAAMIERAARENDEVHVYVSLSDRKRTGDEVPILGTDMAELWQQTITASLPANVTVSYGGSPVGNVWKELGAANEAHSDDTYTVYGDSDDLAQSFPDNSMDKYCGDLFRAGRVKRGVTERLASGTTLRQHLASGDRDSFLRELPTSIDRDLVWNVLRRTALDPPKVKTTAGPTRKRRVAEDLIRSYVKLLVDD